MNKLLVFFAAATFCIGANGQYKEGVIVEPVLKTDTTSIGQKLKFPDFQENEITISKVTILPGKSTGWHKHNIPVFAYISEGNLTVELENGKEMEFPEHTSFAEMRDVYHNGKNNGTENVVLIAFYLGEKGKKLSIPKSDDGSSLISAAGTASYSDTVRVSDFGLTPGTRENAVPFVKKAIAECRNKTKPVLIFPEGRYDFWPQYADEKLYYESNTDVIPLRRCAILLENLTDLTVDCGGSEFIFHDRIQPFTVDHSNTVTIKNVSIDWDIPLTAQAEITDVTEKYIDISINVNESPYIIEDEKIVFVGEGWKSRWNGVMEFERSSGIVTPQTGDPGCLGNNWSRYKAQELSYGHVRLYNNFNRKPAKGNFFVMRHSERDHAGTFITDSKNVSIINMNMYHNAGLGILSQYSEDLTFRKVNSVPNPAKHRILSGHDDGLHYSNCKGQILVDSCRFLHLMDDPINVHGTSVRIIEKKNDRTLVCKFMHPQSIGFVWARVGERIGFIENDAMNTVAEGVVESFRTIDPEVFEISFHDPAPSSVTSGDALENLTWTPDVLIRNSFFGSNRARGILVTTPGKVVIENNIFESSGSAILIAGDANQWYESGAVRDVLIRNNIFNDPCMTSMYQFCEGIISIYPEIPKPELNKPFHRNIRIENNEFHPYDYPVLYAKSVSGLTFSGNRLIRSTAFEPFHPRKVMISLENCLNINVAGNTFTGDVLGMNISLAGTPRKQLKIDSRQKLKIE
jgi:quercetin dioxygenase-like cupin family protein